MSDFNKSGARAVADLAEGRLLARVRQDRGCSGARISGTDLKRDHKWWVRPGVFDTREGSGDVRVGGRWLAAGMSRGQPYLQQGEFPEIEAPHKLVHPWDRAGKPEAPSTVNIYWSNSMEEHA